MQAGDFPAERDERLACHHVCDGERGREALAECAATCRASSSIPMVKALMSAPDEDTRATQGGGVTSAILSASWATSSKATCDCVAIRAWMFGGRRFVHKVRRKFDGTDGPASVRRWGRIWVVLRSSISSCINSWRTRCSSESDGRLINSVLILSKACVLGVGYDILHLRRIFVIKLWDDVVKFLCVLRDVRQSKLTLELRKPHGWLFGPERRDTNTDAVDGKSRIRRLLRPYWWVSVLLHDVFVGSPVWWYRYEFPDTHNTHANAQLYVHAAILLRVVKFLQPAACLLLHWNRVTHWHHFAAATALATLSQCL